MSKSKSGRLLISACALAIGGAKLLAKSRKLSIAGRVALVTGGSRGLGLIMAEELARQGAKVAICARNVRELDEARSLILKAVPDAEVLTVRCDVTRVDEVEAMIERVASELGPVELLVNNAGEIQVAPVENLTRDAFEAADKVLYFGVVYPTLAVLPAMLEHRRGSIINIASFGGMVRFPHMLPYSAAKSAVVGFSEGLTAEMAGKGVDVLTVAPGLLRTGSYVNAQFGGDADEEYTWFAFGAVLPGVAMDARLAARRIIAAARRRETRLVLGWPAVVVERSHAFFPRLTVFALGLVNRFILPKPARGGAPTRMIGGSDIAGIPRSHAKSSPAHAQQTAS